MEWRRGVRNDEYWKSVPDGIWKNLSIAGKQSDKKGKTSGWGQYSDYLAKTQDIESAVEQSISYGEFFRNAPKPNPDRMLIKGTVCGVRVEEIQEPLMREIRYLDKLVDELTKGKPMHVILRNSEKKTYQFQAVIEPVPDKGGAYVRFPYDIRKEFGKGRVKAEITFDGKPYCGSIVNMGVKNPDGSICYIIGIWKEIRNKIGKQPGDQVTVTVKEV